MLPNIQLAPTYHLGPVPVSPFGLLVVIGILLGRWLTLRRAKEAGIRRSDIDDAIFYTLLAAFACAHFVEAIFYHPQRLEREGLIYLLKFWAGLSSFGGFLGGVLGYVLFVWRRKVRSPLVLAETILQGLVLGWVFGRLGCTVAFDHPGVQSDFFLAFEQPGGPRHNLGFYEFLFTAFLLFPITLVLHRYKARPGSYIAAVAILYAPVRFFMDFLRIPAEQSGDLRYLWMTPAQYGCLALFLFGIYLLMRIYPRKKACAVCGAVMLAAGLLSGQPAQAGLGNEKTIAINTVAGFPDLVGLQLSYVGLQNFAFGAGFGTFPISRLINNQVPLSKIPITLSSGGPYAVYPNTNYSVTDFSLFTRWFPFSGSFFLNLGYSMLSASGSMSGNITNESSGGTSYGAITGNVRLSQPMLNMGFGWQYAADNGFFFNGGLGVSYLFRTRNSVSVGGSFASIAPLDPKAEEALDTVRTELTDQISSGVSSMREKVTVIPGLFLSIGWAFDLG